MHARRPRWKLGDYKPLRKVVAAASGHQMLASLPRLRWAKRPLSRWVVVVAHLGLCQESSRYPLWRRAHRSPSYPASRDCGCVIRRLPRVCAVCNVYVSIPSLHVPISFVAMIWQSPGVLASVTRRLQCPLGAWRPLLGLGGCASENATNSQMMPSARGARPCGAAAASHRHCGRDCGQSGVMAMFGVD